MASKAFEQARETWHKTFAGLPLKVSLGGPAAPFWRQINNIYVKSDRLTPEGVKMFVAACGEFVAFIKTKDGTIVPSLEAKCRALYTALYA
jgi:hypothetical protein